MLFEKDHVCVAPRRDEYRDVWKAWKEGFFESSPGKKIDESYTRARNEIGTVNVPVLVLRCGTSACSDGVGNCFKVGTMPK